MAEEFSESASADTAELFRTVAVASRDFLCARSSAKHLPHVTLFKEIFYVVMRGATLITLMLQMRKLRDLPKKKLGAEPAR